jgi:hypothetical protein
MSHKMASKVRGAVVGVLVVAVVLVALAFIEDLLLGSSSSWTVVLVGRPAAGVPVLLGENAAVMTVPQGIIIHNTSPIKLC